MFLEERTPGAQGFDGGWRHLCTLPCQTVVTSDPYAAHRIVDGKSSRPVVIRGEEGANRVVRYERAGELGVPLIVGGIAVVATGAVLGAAGFLKALSHVTIWGCGGDKLCEAEEARTRGADDADRATARTMMGVGVALGIVGALAILVGALDASSSASAKVSSPPDDRRAHIQPPSPTWARPELPRPAHHATLLEVHF